MNSDSLSLHATIDPEAHLILDAQVNAMAACALVDSGATGVFMHPQFAQECNAVLQPKQVPQEVKAIDGRIINSGLITHQATVQLTLGGHQETLMVDITNTGRYSIILGTPWLTKHDPNIR